MEKKENWENFNGFTEILGVEIDENKYFLQPSCNGFILTNLKVLKFADCNNKLYQIFDNINKIVYKFDSMKEMILWATA